MKVTDEIERAVADAVERIQRCYARAEALFGPFHEEKGQRRCVRCQRLVVARGASGAVVPMVCEECR